MPSSIPSGFDTAIVEDVAHRPWPMPERPWVVTQTWSHLLFAHWPIAAAHLVAKIPTGLELDLFDGVAWVGVVPFQMSNVGVRGWPGLPGVSTFAELNVRTYVRAGGKPGVLFFSLDAASAVAVWLARSTLNLPYYSAAMSIAVSPGGVDYRSQRRSRTGEALFRATYRPIGDAFEPSAGTFEYFLTERYCLYGQTRRGHVYRLEIHHPPWALQRADAEIAINSMTAPVGIVLPPCPPLLHFAARQDAVAWLPRALTAQ